MPRYKHHKSKLEELTKKEKEKEKEVVQYPANENSTNTTPLAPSVMSKAMKGSGVLARLDEVGKKNKVKVKLKT